MGNISDKLSALVESQHPELEVELNVMPSRGVAGENVNALAKDLSRLAADKNSVEVVPFGPMVFMRGKLGSVRAISDHPGVEFVDLNGTADIEDLTDDKV